MTFKFEKLITWQKVMNLSVKIYHLTRDFPSEEKYLLTSQIKRATDSINLSIAEGSTGQINEQFSIFPGYAIRSGIEGIACLYTVQRRKLIPGTEFQNGYNLTEEVIKIIQGLRNSLKAEE